MFWVFDFLAIWLPYVGFKFLTDPAPLQPVTACAPPKTRVHPPGTLARNLHLLNSWLSAFLTVTYRRSQLSCLVFFLCALNLLLCHLQLCYNGNRSRQLGSSEDFPSTTSSQNCRHRSGWVCQCRDLVWVESRLTKGWLTELRVNRV